MDQPGGGSTFARLQLGAMLRARRAAAGMNGVEAAARIRSSASKISRLESGLRPVRPRDLEELLDLYGVTDPAERGRLLELARQSDGPGVWDEFAQALPSAGAVQALNLEAAASLICCYDPLAVPALLQTAEYALLLAQRSGLLSPIVRGGLRPDMLALRRQVLLRDRPPHVWALLDEGVLRRPDVDPDIRQRQLAHLVHVSARGSAVSLQIVPAGALDTLTAAGPFTILRFLSGRDLPDMALLEDLTTISTVERTREVDRYWDLFNRLVVIARDPDTSRQMLRDAAGMEDR
jgi:transcriptional regulator with XRE-family HTH domain